MWGSYVVVDGVFLMRYRMIISLGLLGIILTAGVMVLMDTKAQEGPDETPFGFTNEFWYDGLGSYTDLDPSVDLAVSENGPDVKLEVVIQFHPPISERDIEAAREAGFEVLHRMTALPAIYARGDRGAIERISRYEGTFWIEHDMQMEFMMDMTTSTINASKTWEMPIIDSVNKEYPAITGEGITVVVLDSGVDAGHPDLDLGEKTIKNYKSDSDFVWREVENGDTSSGHGTHCAGTVAGNGDASAGSRAGVAIGAKLIGLSTGEAVSIINALGGMEWVYEHSKPGHTYEWEDPIRVVSNSWGPAPGDYNPEDSISIISQKMTFENNVLVVFAASNSGGDGSDIQTNPYGNVPSNIAVAAIARDGSGVASFSSRGELGIHTTYPDVGAPGVGIWSTAARRTMISVMTKQSAGGLSNIDPYYFAISGTSMATPHIAGVVALILEAYPDLKMSHVFEEAEQEKLDAGWQNDTRNLVHEVELILEASTRYIEPSDEGTPLAENYVPQNYSIGWNGKPFDFAQGFGIVRVDHAIGLTLALKELRTRDFNGDGVTDYPDACIHEAIAQYEKTMVTRSKTYETNRLYTSWNGEWSRFSNQTNSLIPMNHDTSKMVYIPEGAQEMEIRFTYDPWNTDDKRIASLYVTIDQTGDGRPDYTQSGELITDARVSTIPVNQDAWDSYWSVNVEGRGIDWDIGDRFRETQFKEVRAEFTISLNVTLGSGGNELDLQDMHAKNAYWKPFVPFDNPVQDSFVNQTEYIFDLGMITPLEEESAKEEEPANLTWLWILLALAAIAGVGYFLYTKTRKKNTPPPS
jgi:subtilisin family serine protease